MREKLTKLRTNPTALAVWVLLVCGSYVLLFGAEYRENSTIRTRLPWTIIALVSVLLVHEILHAAAAMMLCKGKVKIEVARDPMGLPAMRTVFPGNIKKSSRIVICLVPFVVLTIIPTIYIIAVQPVFFLFLVAMLNGCGAFFDLVDVLILTASKENGKNG